MSVRRNALQFKGNYRSDHQTNGVILAWFRRPGAKPTPVSLPTSIPSPVPVTDTRRRPTWAGRPLRVLRAPRGAAVNRLAAVRRRLLANEPPTLTGAVIAQQHRTEDREAHQFDEIGLRPYRRRIGPDNRLDRHSGRQGSRLGFFGLAPIVGLKSCIDPSNLSVPI
jgi:hypothetical protein